MVEEATTKRVEVTFVGTPPTGQIERASGVSDVEVDGQLVRCLVYGSFQPFLEAVRGYEVIALTATPALDGTQAELPGDERGTPRSPADKRMQRPVPTPPELNETNEASVPELSPIGAHPSTQGE
jgi:hypothetical protein